MNPLNLEIPYCFFEEEKRDGYLVSACTKKVWAVELDLLNEFSKVCEKHNLRWFVHAGTMLGAIRHKGFIPWDDDIDLVMPRCDFEKLYSIGPQEFKQPYFYQTEGTDKLFARNFARLRNSKTTAIQEWERDFRYPYNQGIFIDIFPMDNIPDDESERKEYYSQLTVLNDKAWQWRNMVFFFHPKKGKGWVKRNNYFLKHLWYKYLSKKKGDYNYYLKRHHALVTKYDEVNTKCVGESIVAPLGRWIWEQKWVENVKYVPFEMLMVPVPVEFEDCLRVGFGDNWRIPKQVPNLHGNVLFDADKPYIEYLRYS